MSDAERQKAIAAALEAAQRGRWQEIKTAQYWWDINNPAPVRRWTAEDLYAAKVDEGARLTGAFTTFHGVHDILWALACYFTEDARFEDLSDGYSLGKGLLLMGDIGQGKTTLMQLFRDNPRCKYRLVSCRDVAGAFSAGGPDGLMPYYGQSQGGTCFDDLGTEPPESQHFGNKTNALADVLLGRYDSYQRANLRGWQTHLTTNLSADDLGARYGNRVRSRMRELFNVLAMPASIPDLRS